MTPAGTSADAVARLEDAAPVCRLNSGCNAFDECACGWIDDARATLCALAAERDALREALEAGVALTVAGASAPRTLTLISEDGAARLAKLCGVWAPLARAALGSRDPHRGGAG